MHRNSDEFGLQDSDGGSSVFTILFTGSGQSPGKVAAAMNEHPVLDIATYSRIDEFVRIASSAVARAQEESRKLGVPYVYSINGRIYFELPSGELSATDPYTDRPKGI